ncbi:heavy-metal-associated domain-containing protein [Kribbella sp. NPDC056861]|uniref:heavy-metal-associated domain-containing protein n=1 Tax=Kribbella sp. NPDC056861 TaxID=3154857 RepID=UPI003420D293
MIADSSYDRAAAAQILGDVLADVVLRAEQPFPIAGEPRSTELESMPGSHLGKAQSSYLRTRMQPCPAELVTSATHQVIWNDSGGVVNVAHYGPFGAVVPVVAREATLVLRRALAADSRAQAAAEHLTAGERATMAATTTDRDPIEILSVGLETTARALVQHAYLAEQTPYRDPASFARGLRDSGVFAVVANTWFWGLQSSTYRRGMIPVAFTQKADGGVRYTTRSAAMLRAMKDATIAQARSGRDEDAPAQYVHLPVGEQPRCLANMPTSVGGLRVILLPRVVDAFVETFVRLLEWEESPMSSPVDEVFEVPDMTCSHCTSTVTKVLQTNGVTVSQIDLETKKVVAAFPSPDVRERCFDAIRDRGFTVIAS